MADQIIIEALMLDAFIGVFEHEHNTTQRVRIDLIIDLAPLSGEIYSLGNIVRYDHVVEDIKQLIHAGHIELVETLAEKIAQIVLGYDGVAQVTVGVSKLSAITEAEGVGVRLVRNSS